MYSESRSRLKIHQLHHHLRIQRQQRLSIHQLMRGRERERKKRKKEDITITNTANIFKGIIHLG